MKKVALSWTSLCTTGMVSEAILGIRSLQGLQLHGAPYHESHEVTAAQTLQDGVWEDMKDCL